MTQNDSQTRRFRMDLAYDGRPYAGWQSQAGGNTIQDLMLEALRGICPSIRSVHGSGRTDAGVSANRQVAHFDVPADWRMGATEWRKALNTKLPPSIRVLFCAEADPSFHARFSAAGKRYCYRIFTGEVLPPLSAGLAWHRRGFDREGRLAEVISLFEGTHDFCSFSANRNDGKDATRDSVRTISTAEVIREEPDSIEIRFEGNGFLYKMVRFLVGSAVYCIEGKFPPPEIQRLLQGDHRDQKAPYCAPADGLILEEVYYPPEFSPERELP